MNFRDLPLRRKLMLIIALATGLGLGLSLMMQLATGLRSSRAAAQAQLVGIAQIVAANSTAAIRFDDANAAADTLAGLQAQPEIRRAVLLRADGRVFAAYPASDTHTPHGDAGHGDAAHAEPARGAPSVEGGFWDSTLHIDHPVMQDGEALGTLHLEADLSAMWRQFFERIAVAVATTAVSFGIAFALAARLQRSISQPIMALAAVTEAVGADKDYTRRVAVAQADEVGHLAERFNAMLDELQTRDRELQQHRDHLEQEVDQRTAQLRQAKEQAEAANVAKTRFLANMSHELRTPLNAVIGAAQLIKAGEHDAERRAQLVDAIQRSGTNLLGLIESILDLARIEAGEMKLHPADFHLVECIDAALATAGLAARAKRLQLACIVDPDLPAWRHGDAARLRQVLLNLLGNAVKFTLEGEIVMHVGAARAPDGVRITLADTGVGIAPASLPHVFEPFRQADEGAARRFGGSGLGLAIVQQLVEAMGGSIRVDSTPGEGSCFELTLPLPPAHDSTAETPPPPRRVAYFEPHEPSALALQALLARMGCTAQRCHGSADVAAWCAAHPHDRGGERWLLVATDAADAATLLEPASELLDARRVIGMSSVESYDADLARENFLLPRSVIKPVTRSALASRFVSQAERPTTQPVPLDLLTPQQLEAMTHVLVVEDDALNQAIVSGLLRHAGYRVSTASDGRSALEALGRDTFDVVLMDWQMPDMDGLEVTRRVRAGEAGEAARQWPIVALTANAFAEDRQACLDAGMNDFLTKPVLAAGLMATIERWTRRRPMPTRPGALAAPARAEAAGPAVFDRSLLAALPMVADGSQPDYADEVLELYMNSLPGTLVAVRKALVQDDRRTLQRTAHTLKSASASVGALAVAAVAAQAEQVLRQGEPLPPAVADALQAEIERLAAEMKALRPLRFAKGEPA